MSTTAAQYQFAAEFVTMVVAAAGLVLVALRGPVASRSGVARAALAIGFLATGTVAFLHGARLVLTNGGGGLSAGRLVGAAALLAGSTRWAAGWRTRLALQGGAALGAVAAIVELGTAPGAAVDTVLILAAVLEAAALLGAARSSVAARVATGAASTLLLVVLVLSVALGSVITSSVQRDELQRVTSQAHLEVGQIADLATTAVQDARFVALDLAGYFRSSTPNTLVLLGSGTPPPAAAAVGRRLQQITDLYPVGGFAYADAQGAVVASTLGPQSSLVTGVLRDRVVSGASCSGDGQGSVVVAGGAAWVAAAYPECLATDGRLLGSVISIRPLDRAYLAGRLDVDPGGSLALVASGAVLAAAGPQPPAGTLRQLAAATGPTGSTTRMAGSAVVSAQAVRDASGRSVAALVLSLPGTSLVATRDNLFRTLSLIALGGTALALLLAALIGDRITVGIRSLTGAARRVQEGDTTARAAIGSSDEVGLLGAAFDSMLVAIEEQTVALQGAAEDETRLRNRLEAVVAGMGDALVAIDAAGRITDFNRAAEELTGWPAHEALGVVVGQRLDLRDDDGLSLADRLGRPGPGRWAAIGSLRPAVGPAVPVAVSSGALRGPAGEVAGGVLVLRDLRRERELERMKTEFLSRVGHELRTPLTGILGYADILVRRPVPPERAAAWHEEILGSAKRLLRIVEMLEFFASSGAGRVRLQPEPLDTRALVDTVAAGWAGRAPDGIEVVRRVARATPPVMADRRWVALAVDELIDYAFEFSPAGGRLRFCARRAGSEADGAEAGVAIEVSDRGKGMTPEEQAMAFGEFTQGDESDTRSFGGLGLGLALVRRVVDGQGGSVSCVSRPGRGSTFTITLPAAAPG